MFAKKIIDILCLYIDGAITYLEMVKKLSEAGPEPDLIKILPDTPGSFPQIKGLKEKVIEILHSDTLNISSSGFQDNEETPHSKLILKDYMSWLSDEYWCAGWLIGLEYILWDLLVDPKSDAYFGSFDQRHLDRLKWLFEGANCWFYWDNSISKVLPISLSDWDKKYKLWKKRALSNKRPSIINHN